MAGVALLLAGCGTPQNPVVGAAEVTSQIGSAHVSMSSSDTRVSGVIDPVADSGTLTLANSKVRRPLIVTRDSFYFEQSGAWDRFPVQDQLEAFDPNLVIASLKRIGAVTRVGSGSIAGVRTTEYRGSTRISQTVRQLASVWIDDAQQIRRIQLRYDGDGRVWPVWVTLDLDHFGEAVPISAPRVYTNLG